MHAAVRKRISILALFIQPLDFLGTRGRRRTAKNDLYVEGFDQPLYFSPILTFLFNLPFNRSPFYLRFSVSLQVPLLGFAAVDV